jgi:hypothetical protein
MQNAYGLIVGIANYRYVNSLSAHVRNDAADIYALLTDPTVGGYPAEKVRLLIDDNGTLAALSGEFERLAMQADPDSTVFIYFSGHGGRVPDGPDAGEFLLAADTRLKMTSTTYTIDVSTALSGSQFSAALQAIPARKLIVMLDCCHSGGVGDLAKSDGDLSFKAGLSEQMLEQLSSGRGRVIISSSRDSELSFIRPSDSNSIFTKHLKQGLLGGAPGRDGYIHIFDLFEYVQPRVTADQPVQHPVLQAKIEENLRVALFLGGQKQPTAPNETKIATEFRYDAYISWVRAPDDTAWMRSRILTVLQQAGLRVAMTGAVNEPGVPTIIGVPRAIELSKRIVVVLSRTYLRNSWGNLDTILAQQVSIEEQRARLLPIVIDDSLLDEQRHFKQDVPLSLRILTALDLVDPLFGAGNLARLPEIIRAPLPLW